jgi:hypothetical protein
MLRLLVTGLVLNCAIFASAHQPGGGGLLGHALGRHHGDFIGLGSGLGLGNGLGLGLGFGHEHGLGFGLGLGFFNPETLQTRFESRFDDLKLDYETGVTDIPDFYSSDEYADIIADTERLVDRYDLFLGGVEVKIDRLGDFISIANDTLTYFNDRLADYQADPDLSPERLQRIEDRITRITDWIDVKIDWLTDTQTTLQTNLPTYQSFQTDVTTFLTDIVAAGETAGTSSALIAFSANADLSSNLFAAAELVADSAPTGGGSSAIPEPSTILPILIAIGGLVMRSARRR